MISKDYLGLLHGTEQLTCPAISSAWQAFAHAYMHDGNTEVALLHLADTCFSVLVDSANPFNTIIQRAERMHIEKNAGYSGNNPDPWANFRNCEQFGISAVQGCITRMCDKYARYQNLITYQTNAYNESIEDTIFDLGAYALILVCLIREQQYKELAGYEYAES